jgi:hypothetical protein
MNEALSLGAFVALKGFQSEYQLPPTFGIVGLFPKDFSGLGTLQPTTAQDLHTLMQPHEQALTREIVERLIERFHHALQQVNEQVRLSVEQVEFAEAGFADMLWHVFYARTTRPDAPTHTLLHEFIEASLHLSSEDIAYEHGGETWRVCTVSSVFGRIGLRVTMPTQTVYVRDERYLCPMEEGMLELVDGL